MKKILSYILSNIADFPEKISIDEKEEDGVLNFTIALAKEDMGKIIGKNGRMIKSIRNIMKIPAIKQGEKINISLQESS